MVSKAVSLTIRISWNCFGKNCRHINQKTKTGLMYHKPDTIELENKSSFFAHQRILVSFCTQAGRQKYVFIRSRKVTFRCKMEIWWCRTGRNSKVIVSQSKSCIQHGSVLLPLISTRAFKFSLSLYDVFPVVDSSHASMGERTKKNTTAKLFLWLKFILPKRNNSQALFNLIWSFYKANNISFFQNVSVQVLLS